MFDVLKEEISGGRVETRPPGRRTIGNNSKNPLRRRKKYAEQTAFIPTLTGLPVPHAIYVGRRCPALTERVVTAVRVRPTTKKG
jgi:hypothetical protein